MINWFGTDECKTCEVLKMELERAHRKNERLLEILLRKDEPIPEPMQEEKQSPISITGGRRFLPAVVRQQMIEREDRKTLEIMQQRKKELTQQTVEKLEKELGIEEPSA